MTTIEGCEFDPIQYYSSGWSAGPPRGIMFHYTAGCGSPTTVKTTLIERHVSAHFCISRTPATEPTHQYVDIKNRAWHAGEANNYYFGLEHAALPNTCNLTDAQLKESARISAELIKQAKIIWGVSIPVVRAPGCAFSPGFKEHKDGISCSWNPNNHTDGLAQTWTWQEYLQEVKNNLEEDDMALFDDKNEFRQEVRKALTGMDADGNANMSAQEIEQALLFVGGLDIRMSEKPRPAQNHTKQHGWDFADRLLERQTKAGPSSGKITGEITLQ